jgi:hypothetical protein
VLFYLYGLGIKLEPRIKCFKVNDCQSVNHIGGDK